LHSHKEAMCSLSAFIVRLVCSLHYFTSKILLKHKMLCNVNNCECFIESRIQSRPLESVVRMDVKDFILDPYFWILDAVVLICSRSDTYETKSFLKRV